MLPTVMPQSNLRSGATEQPAYALIPEPTHRYSHATEHIFQKRLAYHASRC